MLKKIPEERLQVYLETDFADTESGDFYIRHGKADDKVGKVALYSTFYFNMDRSEVMFVKSGATYICIDGGDKKKYPVCPVQ